MKKNLLISCLFCMVSTVAMSQSYRNDWIDYTKTYYKFMLGMFGNNIDGTPVKGGVVRVSPATLATAGLGGIPAENLQLWRNGVQVPIYTSKPSGILSGADYIEFWGEANDGKIDKDLYANADYQLSDYYSIQTDTAAYFFTYNNSGGNKRFADAANTPAAATIQPDANFMYTLGRYFRNRYSAGYNILVDNEAIISSSYDKGEGWFSNVFTPTASLAYTAASIYNDTLGAPMSVRVNVLGTTNYTRTVKVLINGDSVASKAFNFYDYGKISATNISAKKIKNNTALITIRDSAVSTSDNAMAAMIELDYPRLFNFGNATTFHFNLAPSDTGRLINITNFSAGTSVPVLYDMANGKRYVADVSVPLNYKFLLPASTLGYSLVLVRGDGTTATNITNITQRNFVNYGNNDNQGNYLIISNPLIYGSGATNYVDQYRAYRSSADGGSYTAKVVSVEDLVDQFAYGVKKHPLSVKNFLRYARNTFGVKPAYALLIGKGVLYTSYRNSQNATTEQLNLVPTWGSPGSDNFLSSEDTYNPVPVTPIGRISAVSAQEVGDYLAKLKHYEELQKTGVTETIDDKGYMKNVIQIAGANDASLNTILGTFTNNYTRVITDTLFGGVANNFIQTSNPADYAKAITSFKGIYETGSSLVEYFGHSSSTSLDFGLDNPSAYDTKGKYPVFIVNGCLAGNIFDLDASRLTQRTTISEKFVLEPGKGAIGYISTSSWGIVDYLNLFTQKMYESISKTKYGAGFGEITADAFERGLNPPGGSSLMDDFFARYHAEEYTYHGDPAVKLSPFKKPDYAIEASQLQLQSSYITVADDSYKVKVRIHNLGMAVKDSVHLKVYRKFSDADSTIVFSQKIAPVKGIDSVMITFPIVANRDTGTQYVYAYIDDVNAIDEVDENNNSAFIPVTIYNAEIRPVYPYNYAIINSSSVNLAASTANPLIGSKPYTVEMDTTALFNSGVKLTLNATSIGGVIQFPNVSLPLTAVYYWRVSETGSSHWNLFSFRHDAAANAGSGQSHYFQHTKSSFTDINIDSARNFNFDSSLANLYIQEGVYPASAEDRDFSIMLNGTFVALSACVGSSIIFNVFDGITMKPIPNKTNPFSGSGGCATLGVNNFEYSTQSATTRHNANLFLESLAPGTYVVARRVYDIGNVDFANVWRADSVLYHDPITNKAQTMYQTFKDYGLPIDQYSYPRTFVFVYRKGDTKGFTPVGALSAGVTDKVTLSMNMPSLDTTGFITSPQFGPAAAWNKVKWNGFSTENNDFRNVSVIGVNNAGVETPLYTLDSSTHEFNLSGVDPLVYPYAKLKMKNQDSILANPYQLTNWNIEFQPVAEGAIAPNLGMKIPDTLNFDHAENIQFDSLTGYVAFKNVSIANFKPLKLKASLTDADGNVYPFPLPYGKALNAGDTMHASFVLDVRGLPQGKYNLQLQVNPDLDQPEQYLFNNSLFKYVLINRGTLFPVKLLSFSVAKTPEDLVALTWKVANEINLDRYEIQASADGNDYKTVGMVTATGSSTYGFVHTTPVNGKNYYRLKMVDKDGAFSYSYIRWIDVLKAIITAAPNPFIKNIRITVSDSRQYTVTVQNVGGQTLAKKVFYGNTTISTQGYAAGTYVIKIDDGTTVKTYKLQKQHE